MKVLMSIKPKYADKIFSGEKKWEYRKKIWRRDGITFGTKFLVYASAPTSKVIGRFTVGTLLCDSPHKLWAFTNACSGISEDAFFDYFINTERGYAIGISATALYDTPKPLSDYGIKRPPQNFMYLPDEGGIDER
jgi:predicted transcriptional regulator